MRVNLYTYTPIYIYIYIITCNKQLYKEYTACVYTACTRIYNHSRPRDVIAAAAAGNDMFKHSLTTDVSLYIYTGRYISHKFFMLRRFICRNDF